MAKKIPALHEVLAVETARKKQAEAILVETKETFTKRRHHFEGAELLVELFQDSGTPEDVALKTTIEAQHSDKKKDIVTTVDEKLKYTLDSIRNMWDVVYQIQESNSRAKADIVVDGITLVSNVPATFLLEFEKKLAEMRDVIHKIPTYDPTKGFKKASGLKVGWYASEPKLTVSTRKDERNEVVIPPTKEHPGQWVTRKVDVPVAKITTTEYSGMYSPLDKSLMLERADKLIRAVRKARMRANNTEACTVKISAALANYILEDKLPSGEREQE